MGDIYHVADLSLSGGRELRVFLLGQLVLAPIPRYMLGSMRIELQLEISGTVTGISTGNNFQQAVI